MSKLVKSQLLFTMFIMILASGPGQSWPLPTVGAVPKADDPKIDVHNPQNWMSKKFILLEQPASLQHFGYQLIRIHQDDFAPPSENNPDLENDLRALLYDKFAGDILTVTDVKAEAASPNGLPREYDIVFNDDKKAIPLYTTTVLGRVHGIAPLEELDLVKTTWMGKAIWSKSRTLWRYDAEKGLPTWVTIPLGERLKVIDISWGSDSEFPVWVIVKRANGETGYYEIAGTPMNKAADLYDDRAYWRNNFYDDDPRKKNQWPQTVWNKVCKGEISIGMTYDQVELALDPPDHINRDIYVSGSTTQWVYTNRYVYFANGKVKAIQDR